MEIDPGKLGGTPVVRGTRVAADTIVQDYELGSPVEEIHENFPSVPVSTVQQLIEFVQVHSN
ncbi:MAG: DUF433 domain-containing protein [Bryobacterales bacterium]|nr:DUF433 domain-containing protein [Bryobacterales bacterium]